MKKNIPLAPMEQTNEPVLSQHVLLATKLLATTEDAIILKSQSDTYEGNYTNAYRLIHGPGHEITKVPFIILYKDESANEVTAIVEELVKDYPDEFEDNLDCYVVPILCDGAYCDSRIKWLTV